MQSIDDLVGSLIVELRRGTLILSVLSQLNHPEYGYSLVQKMEEKNTFYVLSPEGKQVYHRLKTEWKALSRQLESLMLEDDENE